MAPFRKEQLEKFAWSWAETCNPNQITIENVNAAYRILLMKCKVGCCRRNCKGNPYCLSNLGEHRWLECSEETGNSLNDTERKKRKAGAFVGLKNLGATCYVNSLLQLWFHNLNFRKGIYKWSPVEDPEENTNITLNTEKYMPITAVGHLQVIFALLQYGNQKYIDTSDFVNCLRIDVSIQQDAQEFSKLLLSILETSLKFQSVKEVNDMIKDNFCGEYSYITRCLNCLTESRCPSTFYELDLNIHGHKTIQDSLKEFMQIELLEGDDKYFCAVCKEKQDAQRFISLTQLPPVLNLQLKRFVFDKNLGYKKKLNTYISFPDVLNMTEFLPDSNGEIEYTLSAVLIHSGRGANAGHYVAYICDSVSKLWYKFNDESVEEMDGKKFRLSCDDEYEPEGTKKAKLPRVPKGSYNSSNAYMLVYTLSKPKNDVAKFCRCETDNDFPLPDYLRNLVDKKNQDFNEMVQLVTVDNENEMNLQRTTAVEMVQLITMLPVETDEEDFDAISSQWLTSWLSQNNFDEEINNNNIICPHGKLDPTLLIDTKYINSDTADQLYDKYGGGPRLRSDYFSCIKCVANNCYKIRVKNKTAEEAKEICSRMRNRINEEEVNYWVGKMSLRSWRRLVLESLDDIVESSTLNMSYLEDTMQGSNNRYDGIPKVDSVKALVNNYNDDSSNSNNNINGCSLFRRVIPVINLPRYFEENDILRNEFVLEEGSIVLTAAETCKLIKCYTNTLEPNCKMSEVNEMLWDILQNHLPATFPKKLPNSINNSNNNNNNNSINNINNSNNNIDSNDIKENGISSLVNNFEKPVTSLDSCTISNGGVNIKNELINKNCGPINGIITSSTGVNGIIPNDNNIKREKFGHFVSNGSNGQYINNNSLQSINGISLTTSEEQNNQAISSSGTEPDIKCNNSSSIITNGICSPNNNKQTNKIKEENNEDNVSENEKLKFNEDIVCSHGNMCIEENNRRLVPPAVWGIFRKYFGNAKQFTTLDRPCGLCKSKATKDEIAKYLYKMDAQNQKELLSNLYLDRNRPFSSSKSDENATLFYIVNRDFINSWKKFIKEAGKKEPPDSINNELTLLCTEHSKLLYDVNSGGIDKVQERICLVTEAEWKILTQMYKVDRAITVECSSDGRLVVDPKVCVTCMQARIEMETKAQFCYERAKLYIKILSNEEVDSPAEENYPSSKRAKIMSPEVNNASSDVTSCYENNQTTTATANCAANASNAVSVITEIRRSSRPRRKTGLKELVVSSDMTLLDIKKKICSLINVAPMDQHLSKLDGSYLTENTSSLGELGILPGEVLNLKVDEPCESDGVEEFIQQSLQPEAGFKGTVLLGCFKSVAN